VSNGTPWTADDTRELRRLVASGLTDGQIGEKMGRERELICRKRNLLELAPGQSRAMTVALRRIRARRKTQERTGDDASA
jgi:hypothetical protein